ncbi:homeodomain-interacting protein kinase 1-like isoform X4 [Pseudochaenichthys georgianus]|uniref:homeodomain-interacting protein kinase 1-like isoform X4 n=1 Tax=Pseudochaenichthys georgianus TaxID=52239 RepID=UPI00146DD181|nr:homeodomain-interacting protein kinase 1-like isoform X1 [Pseudochaenichthys georgianus]
MPDNFQVEEGAMLYSKSSAYEVQYLLGRGSFGEVAQCRKFATNENVAIKVIRSKHSIEDAKSEEDILKQMKLLNSHFFNIVVWNYSFQYKERYCIEFEKLDINLHEFLQKRSSMSLKLKEIRPIVQQLAIALDFLDVVDIVHGDLKPENIMMVDHVRQPLKVKLIDFGLAVNNSAQHTGETMQTLYYRSPEIVLGNEFNGAIDVWSLGCIAAEMLTGNVLFPGSDEYDMLRHIILGIGEPPRHLLNAGMFTNIFFCATMREEEPPVWRFKTPLEGRHFELVPRTICNLRDLIKKPDKLSDNPKVCDCEHQSFFDLLTKMLMVDAADRITPSQIQEHAFITMSDLSGDSKSCSHVKSCFSQSSDDEEDDDLEVASSSTAIPAGQTESGGLSSDEHTPFAGHTAEKKRKRDGGKTTKKTPLLKRKRDQAKPCSSSAKKRKTVNLNENLEDSVNKLLNKTVEVPSKKRKRADEETCPEERSGCKRRVNFSP